MGNASSAKIHVEIVEESKHERKLGKSSSSTGTGTLASENDGYVKIFDLLSNSGEWSKISKYLSENTHLASRVISADHAGNILPIHYVMTKNVPADIVKQLISIFPQGILKADIDGKTALHYALINKKNIEIIKVLVDADYDIVNKKTLLGKLPIHFAIEFNSSAFDIVELLLEKNPEGVNEYCEAKLPLHFACKHKSNIKIIDLLLSLYPQGVRERGSDRMLPIHFATLYRSHFSVITRLISLYTEGLFIRDKHGRLPLHYAIEKKLSDDIVQALLYAMPETAQSRGFGGYLPLHMAVEKHASISVINALLTHFIDAAEEKDKFGTLPLQYAMKTNCEESVISSLIDAYPNGIKEIDEYGRITLHYAISRKLSLPFVEKLLTVHPDGASTCDQDGQLPLHLAIKRNADLNIINLLLKLHPAGVLLTDKYEYLPIHYALEDSSISIEKLTALIACNPKCLEIRCKGKLAIHFAIEFKRTYNYIKIIAENYMYGMQDREHIKGRLPICWAMERYLSIDILLMLHALFPQGCAVLEDYAGLLPIHYAVRYHVHVELVRLLLVEYPDIARIRNSPIHNNKNKNSNIISNSFKNDLLPEIDIDDNKEEVDENDNGNDNVVTKPLTDKLVKYGQHFRRLHGKLLLHYAVEDMQALPKTVAEILLLTMPLQYATGEPYPEHYSTWTYLLAECHDKYFESVDIVLQKYDQAAAYIKYLSNFPDGQGHKAIDIATTKCLREILVRMYFCGRYEIHKGNYMHKSMNSLIRLAVDHEDDKRLVALKFMRNRQQFDREVNLRGGLSVGLGTGMKANDYVLEMLRYMDSDGDPIYRQEAARKGYGQYAYCIVMVAADRDLLSIITHENFVGGKDWKKVKVICTQILESLSFIHAQGIVCGDLKPLNLMRENDRIKVIDLGASVSFTKKEIAGIHKTSCAYLPPELVATLSQELAESALIKHSTVSFSMTTMNSTHENNSHTAADYVVNGLVVNNNSNGSFRGSLNAVRQQQKVSTKELTVLADPLQDMWSFGVVFYLLCTGEHLFSCNSEDNISDQRYLKLLVEWPDRLKIQKLSKVLDINARNLLFQLLSKSPHRRPSIVKCMEHPYFSGNACARFPGQVAEYDVYIAHKLKYIPNNTNEKEDCSKDFDNNIMDKKIVMKLYDDDAHVDILCSLLQDKGLKVTSSKSGISSTTSTSLNNTKHKNESQALKIDIVKSNKTPDLKDDFYDIDDDDDFLDFDKFKSKQFQKEVVPTEIVNHANNNINGKDYFMNNAIRMIKSKSVVFVFSRFAINNYLNGSSLEKINPNDPINQLLFEMRFAIELRNLNLLENGISVVLIGDVTSNSYGDEEFEDVSHINIYDGFYDSSNLVIEDCSYNLYFTHYEGELLGRYGSCHPEILPHHSVTSVEEKVAQCLDAQFLGTPTILKLSVSDIVNDIISYQNYMVNGRGDSAWKDVADDLFSWFSDKFPNDTFPNTRPPSTAESYTHPKTPKSPGFSRAASRLALSRHSFQAAADDIQATAAGVGLSWGTMSFGNSRNSGMGIGTSLFDRTDADLAEISLLQGESVALAFMSEKIHNKNNELDNMQIEMALLQRQLDLKTQDLIRLRHKFNVE